MELPSEIYDEVKDLLNNEKGTLFHEVATGVFQNIETKEIYNGDEKALKKALFFKYIIIKDDGSKELWRFMVLFNRDFICN